MFKLAALAFWVATSPATNTGQHAWQIDKRTDPITDDVVVLTMSKTSHPLRRPEYPLSDIKATLGFSCLPGSDISLVGIELTKSLTIQDGERIGSGSEMAFQARIRWDNEPALRERVTYQSIATRMFQLRGEIAEEIKEHKSLLFEIEPNLHNAIVFKFDLTGAAKAIKEAQEICA